MYEYEKRKIYKDFECLLLSRLSPLLSVSQSGIIYWDSFINDFMKEIHIIEIKPKG